MPLIQSSTDTRTPAQQAADDIRLAVTACFNAMVQTQRHVFRALWRNPQAAPQDILDALGSDALQLFEMGGANVQTLLTFQSGCIAPEDYAPPFPVTFNPDGSVTIEPPSEA